MARTENSTNNATEIFLKNNGFLRAGEAMDQGIDSHQLYAMRDQGQVDVIARGLFRLKTMPPLKDPQLFTIAAKMRQGVLCLESALAFHQLIDLKPADFHVALPKGTQRPQLEQLSLKYIWITEPAYSEGIELRDVDGAKLRIYNVEKTLADCFKFRNKLGIQICLQALHTWIKREDKDIGKLLEYSKICRVEKTVRPYLDALLVGNKN